MRHDKQLLEALARIPPQPWEGEVFRHMFADFPPERENTSGARWNLPEVPAIYTSLAREVVLAEADYHIAMQPLRPKARRTVYRIAVRLASVLDISEPKLLSNLGLTDAVLRGDNIEPCQRVGSGAEYLGHDGLIVPSVRTPGLNLVIYPNRTVEATYRFEVIDTEVIDPGSRW